MNRCQGIEINLLPIWSIFRCSVYQRSFCHQCIILKCYPWISLGDDPIVRHCQHCSCSTSTGCCKSSTKCTVKSTAKCSEWRCWEGMRCSMGAKSRSTAAGGNKIWAVARGHSGGRERVFWEGEGWTRREQVRTRRGGEVAAGLQPESYLGMCKKGLQPGHHMKEALTCRSSLPAALPPLVQEALQSKTPTTCSLFLKAQ